MGATDHEPPTDEFLENLRLLKEISDLSRVRLEPRLVYQKIVTNTSNLLRVEMCSLVLEAAEDGLFRIIAAQGLNPEIVEKTVIRVGEGISGHVVKTGQPLLIKDIENHPLFQKKSGRQYTTTSLLSLPLVSDGRTIGVLNVNNKRNRRPFGELDQFFLGIIANYIVDVIDKLEMDEERVRHRTIERDLHAAADIQKHLFPHQLPIREDFEVQAENLPARQLGGDLYDVIQTAKNSFVIAIGDVSGKGIAAALYMSNLAGKLRLLARKMKDPARILEVVNTALVEESIKGNFATLLLGFYNRRTRRLVYSVAGHLPPLWRRSAARRVETLAPAGGPPVGILAGVRYPVNELVLGPGDALLFYTDGVTEAANPAGEHYGFPRLLERLEDFGLGNEALIGSVIRDLEEFIGTRERSDDITMLNLIVRGSDGPRRRDRNAG